MRKLMTPDGLTAYSGNSDEELMYQMFLDASRWTGDDSVAQWARGVATRCYSLFSRTPRTCCARHFVADLVELGCVMEVH